MSVCAPTGLATTTAVAAASSPKTLILFMFEAPSWGRFDRRRDVSCSNRRASPIGWRGPPTMLRCCRESRHFVRLCLFPNQRRSDCSAAAIGGVAPGRNEQRHVVVALRFGDREPDGHDVEEWRITLEGLQAREIIADMERKLVTPERLRRPAHQRRIGAAVALACGTRDAALLPACG